jgi:ABC-type multidrug transport system fused ATPase/permease subunit
LKKCKVLIISFACERLLIIINSLKKNVEAFVYCAMTKSSLNRIRCNQWKKHLNNSRSIWSTENYSSKWCELNSHQFTIIQIDVNYKVSFQKFNLIHFFSSYRDFFMSFHQTYAKKDTCCIYNFTKEKKYIKEKLILSNKLSNKLSKKFLIMFLNMLLIMLAIIFIMFTIMFAIILVIMLAMIYYVMWLFIILQIAKIVY